MVTEAVVLMPTPGSDKVKKKFFLSVKLKIKRGTQERYQDICLWGGRGECRTSPKKASREEHEVKDWWSE